MGSSDVCSTLVMGLVVLFLVAIACKRHDLFPPHFGPHYRGGGTTPCSGRVATGDGPREEPTAASARRATSQMPYGSALDEDDDENPTATPLQAPQNQEDFEAQFKGVKTAKQKNVAELTMALEQELTLEASHARSIGSNILRSAASMCTDKKVVVPKPSAESMFYLPAAAEVS